jgi:hypothetical protein
VSNFRQLRRAFVVGCCRLTPVEACVESDWSTYTQLLKLRFVELLSKSTSIVNLRRYIVGDFLSTSTFVVGGQLGTGAGHGLTLVHYSGQPEPFLTHNTPSTPPNTPKHPLNTTETTPRSTPYRTESAYVEL